ncbi:hypothetical protein N2A98_07435 [Pseudomonas sp. FJ2-5-13]|uniref:Uncharacterized protein n=1 Tax=Pseudomonas salomonii TaxID=191391 RepID=A0A1H3J2M0_9PSED|nr:MULTISPECIES: hypothetical protein [Pseudomonas]WEJ07118.1 hypothetical protein N2A98_07435 [Pseudomonas sp. FJ2-5-13]SDY34171.1 hypothetical protein SAMN05216247_103440 [Pseudomonas salomonii]
MSIWTFSLKKSVLLPIGGIVATWLLTKILDAYLDITILANLWGWLVQRSEWLFQEVPMPLWLLVCTTISGLSVIAALAYALMELRRSECEIHRLRHPVDTPLNDLEHMVLMTIAGFLENNMHASRRDLQERVGTTPLPVQAALDVLTTRGLVGDELAGNAVYIGLTPAGRRYALHPDNLRRT